MFKLFTYGSLYDDRDHEDDEDPIVKLVGGANEEADHKGWCDTELSENEQTRKEKSGAVETLHAEIGEFEASNAKLTEEITELAMKAMIAMEVVEKKKATGATTLPRVMKTCVAVGMQIFVKGLTT